VAEPGPPEEPGDADDPQVPPTPPHLLAWSSSGTPPPPLPPPPPPPRFSPSPAPGTPPPSTPAASPARVYTGPAPRKRWIVVLVALLSATLVFGAAGTALFFENTWPPLDASYEYFDDLRVGNVDGAFAQLCSVQRQTGREYFATFINNVLPGLERFEVDAFSVDRDGDRASIDATAHRLGADNDLNVKLLLVRERGEWRPCAWTLNPLYD
jgi:hypothetical protein